ncbi:MAG: aminotransferase class V-fold PLP-dependent enzyme [Acidobacteria bacterium]|nr:aminotransferase class V-fold PLP-dependent enzyme [Acidobacteriota bacterium]
MAVPHKDRLFPDLKYKAYLNNAAVAPLSKPVRANIQHLMEAYGSGGVKGLIPAMSEKDQLRANLARIINSPVSWIGITPSTTTGLLWIALEFPWQTGDKLVLVEGEFPGNIVPWQLAAQHYGLEILWLKPEDLLGPNASLDAVLAQKPKLMALSWVQYQTGLTVDLAFISALGRDHHMAVCLDAIQGLGPLRLDLAQTPIDFVCCGGHKWLMGPEGCGFVSAAPHWVDRFNPVYEGWLGVENPIDFLLDGEGLVNYQKPFRRDSSRVELSTANQLGIAGLRAATDILLEVGLEEVSERALAFAHSLRHGLLDLGLPVHTEATQGAIVSFQPEPVFGTVRQIMLAYEQHSVIGATPDGHLRFSPHFWQEWEEIDLCLEASRQIFNPA